MDSGFCHLNKQKALIFPSNNLILVFNCKVVYFTGDIVGNKTANGFLTEVDSNISYESICYPEKTWGRRNFDFSAMSY